MAATKAKPAGKPAAKPAIVPMKDEDIKPWPYTFPPMRNWLGDDGWLTDEAREEARVAKRREELYPFRPATKPSTEVTENVTTDTAVASASD